IRETALDPARFEADYAGAAYEAVLRDCAEGAAWFGVSGLPTVVLNEKLSLVGAVPTDRYRLLIDWILAGAPGGMIPLAPGAATSAGQSPVDTGAAGGETTRRSGYATIRTIDAARSAPISRLYA